MCEIFFGVLLGTFGGIIASVGLLSYVVKKEVSKIIKETTKNRVLNYTIVQYED